MLLKWAITVIEQVSMSLMGHAGLLHVIESTIQ